METMGKNSKKIAFTFDDGPNPDITPKLLEGLKERGVKATFFLIGQEVAKYPNLVKMIHDQGHQIANHSWNHESLSSISKDEVLFQVNKTNEMIESIVGVRPQYIRPPYGNTTKVIEEFTDMIQVTWDIDTRDWEETATKEQIIEAVRKNLDTEQIVLMHDFKETTLEAALFLLDELKEMGYQFITVNQLK